MRYTNFIINYKITKLVNIASQRRHVIDSEGAKELAHLFDHSEVLCVDFVEFRGVLMRSIQSGGQYLVM